jgi:hypothetical protein
MKYSVEVSSYTYIPSFILTSSATHKLMGYIESIAAVPAKSQVYFKKS